MRNIEEAREYAKTKLGPIRAGLEEKFRGTSIGIVAVGSYGRSEASVESDIDWFILDPDSRPEDTSKSLRLDAKSVVDASGIKQQSLTGAFNGVQPWNKLLHEIGGDGESNSQMTRRVLLMLESTSLFNEGVRRKAIKDLMERYVNDDLGNHKIALYFLNDCIRYWRTICIDFEHKTIEERKPWGDRNIKLRFSRKLLFFGGVVAAAQTWNLSPSGKRERLCELLDKDPIERIRDVFKGDADSALAIYDWFLEQMAKSDVRNELKTVDRTQAKQSASPAYTEMKARSHEFGDALRGLLKSLPENHPIHEALLF